MRQITLFFDAKVLWRKSGAYIFKVRQEDNEWNYKWKKDTEGDNPKNKTFVCEIDYSKCQLIKSILQIITFLFLQKPLEEFAVQGYRQIKS